MKTNRTAKTSISVLISIIVFVSSSSLCFGEEKNNTYIYADASGVNNDLRNENETKNSTSGVDWHGILGWATVGMAAVTIGSGFAISEKGHYSLAVITTGLATAACVTGYYKYGSIISFRDGEWKYNIHAVLGSIATAGFITAIALAGDDGSKAHAATGIASGIAFGLTVAVLYF